jgi:transcriptional regulator with XRE-family HTH domain
VINVKNKKLLKAFGARIRELRWAKGLSQEKLANLADIPLSQIGRIERGEINSTISTGYALANALDINMPELYRITIKK